MERDGPSALETTLQFDERQVLEENRAFLSKALEVGIYVMSVKYFSQLYQTRSCFFFLLFVLILVCSQKPFL